MNDDDALRAFQEASLRDVAMLLMAASRTVNAEVLHEIDPDGTSGVRLAHVPIIAVLDAGGTRIGDLAHRVGVTRQAIAALVKDLETAGIVECLPDADDRRATRVHLTPRGIAFCAAATDVMARREAELRERIGAERLETAREVLRELAGG